ncbi:MAG: endonuclease/exonuclease/phosphatase [Thermoguttaceae bacterium]|jgi:hypothetical protein
MGRSLIVLLFTAAGVGGWYVTSHYAIEVHRGQDGRWESVRVASRGVQPGTPGAGDLPPAGPARSAVRIASFDLDGLDDNKLANPQVCDALVRVIPRFDIVAVQGIRSKNRSVLVRLIEQINATGRSYDFATCPTLDRDPVETYNALLFDLTSVEIDRSTVHSVEDSARRFRVKPLLASFRVRGPPESEAFTFTLVNVMVDPRRTPQELDLLADVFRAARDSQRNEDDIIMLGDFDADPDHLGRLAQVPNLAAAINATPTTTRGTRLSDNILFDRRATIEYTGRSAVMDLIRELDLTPQAALEVSEHLPVWAEFSSYEGGQSGHVP